VNRGLAMKKFLTIIIFLFLLVGCENNLTNNYLGGPHYFDAMGTAVGVTLYDGKEEDLDQIKAIFDLYSQLTTNFRRNEVLPDNPYYGLENIYTINQNAGIKAVEVREELIELIQYALEISDETDGYFNIAIGKAVDIWKSVIEEYIFGEVPTEIYQNALAQVLSLTEIDLTKIIIDEENKTVYLTDNSIKLDLGGISKGYAVQKASEYLVSQGIEKFMINAGTSSISVGIHKENRPFRIGLQDSKQIYENSLLGVLQAQDTHLSIGGNAEQHTFYQGMIIHHIISPFDFQPKNYYTSISLVGDNAGLIDAYSTAVFLMEETQTIEFLDSHGLKYVIYLANDELLTNLDEEEFKKSKLIN
jgi:thiamine biosynthesis lipoprotein